MKIRLLLLCGSLLLSGISAMATIVDGVRQKPTYQTSGFAVNQEAYLYNVGSGKFFVNGNSYETQASVGETGLLVKFEATGNGDYLFWDYHNGQWKNTFFDNPNHEGQLYVDRNGWGDYYFAVEDNGSTFRISTSSRNTNYGDYANAGLYVGLPNTGNTTALDGFIGEDEAYVDWALITVENYEALAEDMKIYNKAQELKEWIDKIKAQNGDASSLELVYLNEDATMEQLQEAIDSSRSILINAIIDNAPDKENVDLTIALVNPMFEEGISGWTNGNTVTLAGLPTNKCVEAFNKASFDIYQELADMPVGVYEIEVQGFYRYLRGNDAWAAYKAQSVNYVKPEGVPVYVYLNNNSTPFKNIYSEPVPYGTLYTTDASLLYPSALPPCEDDKGNWYPNEMYNSAVAFNAGMYKQTAYGLIANEGDAFRIGVKGTSNQGNDSWVIWDNFKLYYRGFKAEVVQPVLETAMNDLNQYANMLMGKTEFAQLSKALADAQTAIADQDGEAMFQALNDLYNVKESVIASKDLFLSEDVSTNLADLQEAIANAANEKMSAATRNVAITLEAGIRGNTRYEGTEIQQLKDDVSAASNGLLTSSGLYSQLYDAISNLEAATALKASQALISEANTLIGTAKTGYNEGSIADSEVGELLETLYNKADAIQISATAYTNLNNAITSLQTAATKKAAKTWLDQASEKLTQAQEGYQAGSLSDEAAETLTSSMNALVVNINTSVAAYATLDTAIKNLEAAITTASTDEARVAKSTVTKANLRLNKSKEFYNEGTIADADIPARVASHEQLIEDLTKSINLYKDFKQALDDLNTALATTEPMSAATLTAAQNVYNTAFAAYEAGTVDDEQIEEQKNALNAQIDAINGSVALYGQLNTAITDLEGTLTQYANALASETVRSNANTLLTQAKADYAQGAIADDQVATRKAQLEGAQEALINSVGKYNDLAVAFGKLEPVVGKKAMKALVDEVNRLKALQDDYATGAIADADIDGIIADIEAVIPQVNTSAAAYATLDTAIKNLEAAIATASTDEARVAKSTVTKANLRLDKSKEFYNEGTIADADIPARVASHEQLITDLTYSINLYKDFKEALDNLNTALTTTAQTPMSAATRTAAQNVYNTAFAAYEAGTVDDDQIAEQKTALEAQITAINNSVDKYVDLESALDDLEIALNTTDPMSEATRATAQDLYDDAYAAYDNGDVADDEVEALVDDLYVQVDAIDNSVGLYAGLVTPLADLETALQQKVAKSVFDAATTVFNDASAAYTDGSIADADVASTITSINAQTSALNTSADQYAQLNTALGNFQTAITAAQEAGASVSMITNANSLKAGYQSGYDNGSEENVPAALTAISNAIANLGAAAPLYPQANNLNTKLADLATELGKADDAIAEAEDALEQYLSSELRTGLETALDDLKAKVNVAKTNKSTMADNLAGYQFDLTNSESTLGEDHADLYADMGTAFNTMSGDIDNLISSLGLLRTTLDEKTENAVAESANKVEIAHNIATFCSMMDLDFTGEEKVRAYIVSAFTPSTGDAILTRVYDVPKGTGVVLIGDNGSYEIPAGTGATVVSNLLVGVNRATVLHQVDGDYTNFILTNGESGEGFYPVEDGSTLAAGKAYLPLPTASLPASGIGNGAAIRFVFEDSGEATFIDSVGFDYASSKMEKGVYYNLNGQRVGRPVTGGIYILDGKKVYVK